MYLTTIYGVLAGTIPTGEFACIGTDEIRRKVVRSRGIFNTILMKNHGVFTIGGTARAALKAAVMVEDAARTMFYALQLGEPLEIPPEEVAKLHRRYMKEYGQE